MIIKNLRFIFTLLKLKFSRMMVFRFDFFGAFFVDSSLFILQLLMFEAIYSSVDSIGGFRRGDMIIFIGTFSLINAINIGIWCNGNTADSGPAILGSSPSIPTTKQLF